MKVLICLALVGAILAEVCDAQTCTATELTNYSNQYLTCASTDITPDEATCLLDICSCCTTALNEGDSNSLYTCCVGFRGLLSCGSSTITTPCDTLPAGAAAFAVNAALVLVCAAVTQLFL